MSDHYEALGVERGASDEEIKDAYRRAARKAHPDKGGSPEKFYPVQKAYAVLKDKGRRERYDRGIPEPEDDTRTEALQELARLFMSAVDELDVDHDDLIAAVRFAIQKTKDKVRQARRQVEKGIAKLRSAAKRLGRRKDAKGEDIVGLMLKQSIEKGEGALVEADRERDRLDLMLQMVDDYQYSTDERDLGGMGVEAALRFAMETSMGRTR